MKRVAPLALGISLAVLTAAGAFDDEQARRVFEARCETSCHRLERPLKKNKDRAGWQKTVGRMKGYAAGAITEEDAGLIVEYLSRVRGPRP
jgi:hypothetical protein